jgi:isoquinoline 1-oxidoreductase subunit beta
MSQDTQAPDGGRRAFLRLVALTGGGLCLGLFSPLAAVEAAGATVPDGFTPGAFIQITPDNRVRLFVHRTEMGQGVKTAIPMLIAEELEIGLDQVVVEPIPPRSPVGAQHTWGSQTIATDYDTMRRAGATARVMLIAAAAATWKVPAGECRAVAGTVEHAGRNLRLTYGQLATTAATLPVPTAAQVTLKEAKDFRLIGRWTPGVDNPKLVTGQPLFGLDARVPGMRSAVFVKCPVFGGKPVSANLDAIKRLPGVHDAFLLAGGSNPEELVSGVAIVAAHTWAALAARRALEVVWDEGPGRDHSSVAYDQAAAACADKPGAKVLKQDGDAANGLKQAAKVVTAAYHYPFVAHATMEPMNCTVALTDGMLSIWTGTQTTNKAVAVANQVTRIPVANIGLNLMRCGGGFGRRIYNNFVAEAAAIAQQAKTPIQLVWDRTDDLRGDLFRAGGYHHLRAGLDAHGKLIAWHDHFVTFGFNSTEHTAEGSSLAGDATPRGIAHCLVEKTILSTCLPMGSWRAPAKNTAHFVMQSFLDELALAAGKDPLQFRLDHGFAPARNLQRAAEAAGWGRKLPRGKGLGLAAADGSVQIAEVTVSKDGTLSVDRITVVASTSLIVNPSGAHAQIVGSILDALSASWHQAITIANGRLEQSNFHDYQLLRLPEAPAVEVILDQTPGKIRGMGEPYLAATPAAVTNAIFAATGKRIRRLPIAAHDLSWS